METIDAPALRVKDFISLSDQVWSILHIAMHLGVKESSVLRIVNEPGFPNPIVNTRRNRRWLANDVIDYFTKKSSGELSQSAYAQPNPAYEPKSISFRKV